MTYTQFIRFQGYLLLDVILWILLLKKICFAALVVCLNFAHTVAT